MPNASGEWLFWIFSVVIVGFVLSVVSNLATPRIRSGGEGWLQRIRLRRKTYRERLEKMVLRARQDPSILILEFGYPFIAATGLILVGIIILIIVTSSFAADIRSPDTISGQVGILISLTFCMAGILWLGTTLGRFSDLRRVYQRLSEDDHASPMVEDSIKSPDGD